ncbi:MAG TPA: peptide-methionine (S)-S-oxide reductase MsrA [Rectinemataceae bacterium]
MKSFTRTAGLILATELALFSSCAGDSSGGVSAQTPSERLNAPGSRSLPEAKAPAAAGFPAASPPWAASPPFSSHEFFKPIPPSSEPGMETAILAGGCFWCLEAVYELLPGVVDVVSGYTGGSVPRPSYEYVSTGQSGHAEAVRIVYDSSVVSYERILELFWKIHDPTTLNRQGYDQGPQYRSAIYWTTEAQKAEAQASIADQAQKWKDPIVTELQPAGPFWIAEEYHQDFYRKNPNYGYCALVVAPKVEKSGLGK